ncbi:ArsR/SmtB family transcription factor [Pseudoroseicyclus sp. CXY001]|uniref:ArsR/SmtB family transcription factor n=1 Tax=Pseudoroseicyclus sp. CXY001 TaxID=3242492 RepID=UPI0035710407
MKTNPPPSVDFDLTLMATRFAALGSEQRLGVLQALVRAGPEGLPMGELGARTGISGSTLTHHLKILAQAGLARQVRQGRQIICMGADLDIIDRLSGFLFDQCCADAPKGHDHDGHSHG